MHKNREKNAMRREVNRADIGGKSGNKVKDCHVTINSQSAKSNKRELSTGSSDI